MFCSKRELLEFVIALICAICVFMIIKPILDRNTYEAKNRYYGDVNKPFSDAEKGEFFSWAKTQNNDFLEVISYEVLVAKHKSQDTWSLAKCLESTIGGWWGHVVVPNDLSKFEVIEAATRCTHLLNYHVSSFEDTYLDRWPRTYTP